MAPMHTDVETIPEASLGARGPGSIRSPAPWFSKTQCTADRFPKMHVPTGRVARRGSSLLPDLRKSVLSH
jgi:hypothetical protein